MLSPTRRAFLRGSLVALGLMLTPALSAPRRRWTPVMDATPRPSCSPSFDFSAEGISGQIRRRWPGRRCTPALCREIQANLEIPAMIAREWVTVRSGAYDGLVVTIESPGPGGPWPVVVGVTL